MMKILLIVILRTLHIVASVLWVGGAVVHTAFIEPSVKATQPESRKFIEYFMGQQRFNIYMIASSGVTVLSGAILLWNSSGGLQLRYLQSGPGLVFSLGSLIGLIVYFWGMFLIAPRASRMSTIGAGIAAAGGLPSSDQVMELERLDRELIRYGRVDFVLLLTSLALMASARYWVF